MELLEIRNSRTKPFQIAKILNDGKEEYEVLIGKFKMKTNHQSFETVEKWISTKPYVLIFMISEAMFNYFYNEKTKENGNN